MMKKVRRYIEIYSNVTDEILLRIEIKIGVNQIKAFISIFNNFAIYRKGFTP